MPLLSGPTDPFALCSSLYRLDAKPLVSSSRLCDQWEWGGKGSTVCKQSPGTHSPISLNSMVIAFLKWEGAGEPWLKEPPSSQHLIPLVSYLLHATEVYTERENQAWTFQLTWVARNRLKHREFWVFCVKCQRKEIKETYFWRLGCPMLFSWLH